jgi:hypothetical protein
MRIVLILLFLTANSLVFSQSTKKVIKQLSAQLLLEQQKQDSAYAIFREAKKEYDSIRTLITEKTLGLSMEYGLAERSGELFFKRRAQLQDLGLNADAITAPLTKIDGLPDYKDILAPIRKSDFTAEEFDKVANSISHDKDAKRKELIAIVRKKLIEYQEHERSNEVRLIAMKRNGEQLNSYLRVMDSLSRVYRSVNEELEVKNGKIRDKFRELLNSYKAKGPKGFPEAYQRVFPAAFPSETKEEKLNPEMKLDEVGPAPVEPEGEVYEIVDEYASFPGGTEALEAYINKELKNPQVVENLGFQFNLHMKFVIGEDGSVSNVLVESGAKKCLDCEFEAIRVLKEMPKWIPAKVNGKVVKSFMKYVVRFKLK